MVKIGFICEGFTEFLLIQSPRFKQFLNSINLESVNTINAEGSGNLLPHNISGYIESLKRDGAEKIIILTDLDQDVCITKTKERIAAPADCILIIAVKQIESWFLASTPTMQALLKDDSFFFEFPERESIPFLTINSLLIEKTGRGAGRNMSGKTKLIKRLILLGLDNGTLVITLQVRGLKDNISSGNTKYLAADIVAVQPPQTLQVFYKPTYQQYHIPTEMSYTPYTHFLPSVIQRE